MEDTEKAIEIKVMTKDICVMPLEDMPCDVVYCLFAHVIEGEATGKQTRPELVGGLMIYEGDKTLFLYDKGSAEVLSRTAKGETNDDSTTTGETSERMSMQKDRTGKSM